MSEQKHTPGPWYPDANGTVRARSVVPRPGVEDERVASRLTDADARRIVACVNACEGISTAYLDDLAAGRGIKGHLSAHQTETTRLLEQRGALLAALELIAKSATGTNPDFWTAQVREVARAAIALCKGDL